ncbi:MAG TPA: DNA repair protein RecO [Bacteroidales bacterium]|nr:DNA repair protein RecO [Bacteroidales bacterium]
MIEKDSGIVLHTFKYGDTGVIARIYTKRFGLLSFFVPGLRKARAKMQYNHFQPLTQVEIVFYHNDKGKLLHLKEINCQKPHNDIPFRIIKTSVALFLAEVLIKVLQEPDPYPQLFDFLTNSIDYLEECPTLNPNFHLIFMVQLSQHLGFSPRNNFSQTHCFFNLMDGVYQTTFVESEYVMDKEVSEIFYNLTQCSLTGTDQLTLKNAQRRQMLMKMVEYFCIHISGFKELKSLQVLESVLH